MDRTKQLGEEKISKLLLRFSLPAIVGMLVNALYNVVDRIYIGNGVGPLGIAGITIGFPIMIMFMAFSMLVAHGSTALISLRLGSGNKDEAEHIMGNCLILLVTIAFSLSIGFQIFLEPVLKAFGASESVLPYSMDYLRIILLGTVFQSIGFGLNNIIRAEGNPRIAMFTMLIGGICNIILDPIFIFLLGWGIKGAAFATIISQGLSALWVMKYFLGGRSHLKFRIYNLKPQWDTIILILSLGFAPFALQMANSLLNLVLNKSLSVYGGDVAISAMGIITSIMTLFMMPVIGVNQGMQPIIGYNYGAKNYQRVRETLFLAIGAATAIVLIGFTATRLFPHQLISMFGKKDPELIELGAYSLKTFLLFLPVVGFQIVGSNYFQAIGKPKQAALLSLSRQVLILIPAVLILPQFYELNGILFSGPLADFGSSIITGSYLIYEMKRMKQRMYSVA